MTQHVQIGTVEILRPRVYPLDPEMGGQPLATTVLVEPGVYPVYQWGDARYWLMTGHVNLRHQRLGDGMFLMQNGDESSEIEVKFPSRVLGPDEFTALLAESMCQDGPDQRLRFRIAEAVE